MQNFNYNFRNAKKEQCESFLSKIELSNFRIEFEGLPILGVELSHASKYLCESST